MVTAVVILCKIDHKLVKIDFSLFIFDSHPLSEIRLTFLLRSLPLATMRVSVPDQREKFPKFTSDFDLRKV